MTLERWSNLPGAILFMLAGLAACDFPPPGPAPTGRIVFDSTRSGSKEIRVMNADGSGATRLTNDAGDAKRS